MRLATPAPPIIKTSVAGQEKEVGVGLTGRAAVWAGRPLPHPI